MIAHDNPLTGAHPPSATAKPVKKNAPRGPYGIRPRIRHGRQVGWLVRVHRRGTRISKQFNVCRHGSLAKAYQAAVAFRDQINREVAPLTRRERCAVRNTRNTSGIPGVRRMTCRMTEYWVAVLCLPGTHAKKRCFSVKRYGEKQAFRMAVEARLAMLRELDGIFTLHPELRTAKVAAAPQKPVLIRAPVERDPLPNPYPRRYGCPVVGVHFSRQQTLRSTPEGPRFNGFWVATLSARGISLRSRFSVLALGDEQAMQQAIEQRLAWNREYGIRTRTRPTKAGVNVPAHVAAARTRAAERPLRDAPAVLDPQDGLAVAVPDVTLTGQSALQA